MPKYNLRRPYRGEDGILYGPGREIMVPKSAKLELDEYEERVEQTAKGGEDTPPPPPADAPMRPPSTEDQLKVTRTIMNRSVEDEKQDPNKAPATGTATRPAGMKPAEPPKQEAPKQEKPAKQEDKKSTSSSKSK